MDELKRCSFYDAEAYVIPQVFCDTRQEAIDAWNRRANG